MHQTNRRELLKALGVATAGIAAVGSDAWAEDRVMAAAVHHHLDSQETPVPAHDKFFQGRELASVERLTDLILPSDGTPGAKDANVAAFLDFYMAGSPPSAQSQFRAGLKALDAAASAKSGKAFADLAPVQQQELLESVWPPNSTGDLATFLMNARRLTVFAFYTSKIGVKELGFAGNAFVAEFPGACTHNHEL